MSMDVRKKRLPIPLVISSFTKLSDTELKEGITEIIELETKIHELSKKLPNIFDKTPHLFYQRGRYSSFTFSNPKYLPEFVSSDLSYWFEEAIVSGRYSLKVNFELKMLVHSDEPSYQEINQLIDTNPEKAGLLHAYYVFNLNNTCQKSIELPVNFKSERKAESTGLRISTYKSDMYKEDIILIKLNLKHLENTLKDVVFGRKLS